MVIHSTGAMTARSTIGRQEKGRTMNELEKLIELLKFAVEQGQTFTFTAADITITPGPNGAEVTINNPQLMTES